MTLMREMMVEWCSLAMGGMASCSTPSMRYLMATPESSRVSMWMSLARRSSAVKMVVSTRRMIGPMSLRRRELLDGDGLVRPFSSSRITSRREAFGGFFQHALRLLGLLEQVGDLRERGHLGAQRLTQQQADLVDHHELAGSAMAMSSAPFCALPGARSCSGTSGPREWTGTGRGRWSRPADLRTRTGSAPPACAPVRSPPPDRACGLFQ